MNIPFAIRSLLLGLTALSLACTDGQGRNAGAKDAPEKAAAEPKPLRYEEDFIKGRIASPNIDDHLKGIEGFRPMVLLGKGAVGLFDEAQLKKFVADELKQQKVPVTDDAMAVALAVFVATVPVGSGVTGYEVRVFASEKADVFRKGKRELVYATTWSKQFNGAGFFNQKQLTQAITGHIRRLLENLARGYRERNKPKK